MSEKGKPVKKVAGGDGSKKAIVKPSKGSTEWSGTAPTKPPRFATTTVMKPRHASWAKSGSGIGLGGSGIAMGAGGNYYSPELSTDFLELPQGLQESWNFYRFFYRNEPFVGQALDIHKELPLSKLRVEIPKAQSRDLAEKATRFCARWVQEINLLERLIAIVHDYNLIGEVFIWVEDDNPDLPEDIRYETVREITDEGDALERLVEREDADAREAAWLKKHYQGWTQIRVLPPEQVKMESFSHTNMRLFELIPDSPTKNIIQRAQQGEKRAQAIVESMPAEVVAAVASGQNIPLNTEPEAGSFIHYIANKASDYDPRGHSLLERCMRVLIYRDKIRQAQTSIASRHMTPIRIVYAEDLSMADVEALREQIDMALQDPDFSIVANFEIRWEEMGSDQRLLNLSSEYDLTDRQLYAGLGVTEGLLSGENSYSGDRVNLEVINTRYTLLRERLRKLVEDYLFRPMCYRMGFVEEDEDGREHVIVPKLSFTRLSLRDNNDTFQSLYQLYQKGSLDIDVILEMMNIDPIATRQKLEESLFTVNDPTFNEALRGIYNDSGRRIVENSNVAEKIADYLKLRYEEKSDGGRF